MPRDLTDLMERATSFAPPEAHHAEDITRLAAQRQRRRTSAIAAGLTTAVLVAAAAGYGVTRGHDTTPEPAGRYQYGQELTFGDAVSVESLPGYRPEPWKVPSIEQLQDRHLSPVHTYLGIDSSGRLLVETVPSTNPAGRITVRLYDAPSATPSNVQPPPSPGKNSGQAIQWVPSFSGDGRLIWRSTIQSITAATDGYHVTDLTGDGDAFLPTDQASRVWISRDRVWWTSAQDSDAQGGIYYKLFAAPMSDVRNRTLVAQHVTLADVRSGVAGWITKDGHVFTEDAGGGSASEVPVPYDAGCVMPPAAMLGLSNAFVVGPSMVALTERCHAGQKNETDEMLAFDWSGRLLMHLSGVSAYSMSMGATSLVFWAGKVGDETIGILHYDLATGVLSSLPFEEKQVRDPAPQAAGEYVLWYDHQGGHVARIPQ